MACNSVPLKTTFLPTATTGGSWELIGYAVNSAGPYSLAGGSWPWSSNTNENPTINFNSITPGFYKLRYYKAGNCGGSTEIIVPVINPGYAGVTKTVTVCKGTVINIADELGTEFTGGILEPTFAWSGNGYTSAAFSINNLNTPLDDTFDTGLIAPGTYLITLTVTPATVAGYTTLPCCQITQASLIVNIEPDSIVIGLDQCQLVLSSSIGCVNPTFQLEYNSGSGWVNQGAVTMPYTVPSNGSYRVKAVTGCCAVVTSNIVEATNCCQEPGLSIIYDPGLCMVYIESYGCTTSSGNNIKWYRSCDGGTTWIYQSLLDGMSIIFIDDSCKYRAINICNSGCLSISNTITGTCVACSGQLAASQIGCIYRVASGPICPGAPVKLINQSTGLTVQTKLLDHYPLDFTVPSNGSFYAELTCPGCPPYTGIPFVFSGCGSPPVCNSTLNLSLSGCIITAAVTNCPSPTFEFIRPNGITAYIGSVNNFAADVNGLWIVRATGCPNCSMLQATISVTGCQPNPCSCTPVLTHTPCGALSVTACIGYSIEWQFKPVNGNWAVVQSGGLTYTGTANGLYQVKFTKANCPEVYSNQVEVTCFSNPCSCTPALSLNSTGCTLTYTASSCSGYTLFLQKLVSGNWVDVATNPANPYTVPAGEDNFYRLRAYSPNCPAVVSNIVYVDCAGGACTVEITQFENDLLECGKVLFAWNNSSGSNVSISFAYPTVNPTDCNTAAGWVTFEPESSGYSQGSNTGEAVITEHCGKCIRLIVDDPECYPVAAYLVVPCCCPGDPSIQTVQQTVNYNLKFENSADPLNDNVFRARPINSNQFQVFTNAVLRKTVNGSTTVLSTTEAVGLVNNIFSVASHTGNSGNSTTEAADRVKFRYNGTDYNLDINPATSPYITGAFGTVTTANLYAYNPAVSLTDAETALRLILLNAIKTVVASIDINDIFVKIKTAGSNRSIRVFTKTNWAALWLNDDYLGLFIQMKKTTPISDLAVDNTYINIFNVLSTNISKQVALSCGTLSINSIINHYPVEVDASNMPLNVQGNQYFIIWTLSSELYNSQTSTTFDIWDVYGTAQTEANLLCTEYKLTVINACPGALFLWSNGATKQSINVSSGTYSCIVTCPDGCEYTTDPVTV